MHSVVIRIGEEHETMSLRFATRDEALGLVFCLYDPFWDPIDNTASFLDTLEQLSA